MVKLLDKKASGEIVRVIAEAESGTSGEIRVHVKRGATRDALREAQGLFLKNRMHLTDARNGVLIFISWKSRQFAIVGDEGIHRVVGDSFWNETRDRMGVYFAKNELKEGLIAGVRSAGEKLKAYFPRKYDDRNELPDTVAEEE